MKAHRNNSGRLNGAIHAALLLFALVLMTLTGRAETLLSCTNNSSTGDHIYRGFYVPSYPGNSLDSARLVFSSATAGSYTLRLTVRSNTYDGPLIASDATTFNLAVSTDLPVLFNFPSVRVREGSRVCFLITLVSGPGTVFYGVHNSFTGGCTTVVETEDTTPPLSTHRRDGVNLILTGEDTLIVSSTESIQAAINAASVGETVYVDPGTYRENLRLRSGVNVVGSGYATTILRGVGNTVPFALNTDVVTSSGVTNSRFEGFKITRNARDIDYAGVVINGGSLLLNNNWITGNRDGVRVNGGSPIIRNNIIDKNGDASDAVLNYGVISLSATPLIANNLISSNNGAGIYLGWAASAGTQIINNTVDHNTDTGIWCYNGANAIIKNNIFTYNSTGISATHGSLPVISFNDVWSNTYRNYDSQSGGVANPGPGDISADPRFDLLSVPPYHLALGSPCINAGDPNLFFNDRDGSRNDMGCFGGPSGTLGGVGPSVTSGFLFTSVGNIPTSEITKTGVSAGLANVSPAVGSAIGIPQYKDAPFGGSLWLNGLFGSSDTIVSHYRLSYAKWNGNVPPADADFQPINDPLSKIKYTINPDATVSATLESVGPNAEGLYRRTETGYWAHRDLLAVWNTQSLPDGRYDVIGKGYWYFTFFGSTFPLEASLAPNALSRITLTVNNKQVTVAINRVLDQNGVEIPECGYIPLASNTQNLRFDITASHTNGYLHSYQLDALYGRNQYAGVIARDQYVGSHDGTPPFWFGVNNVISNSAPAQASGALQPWTSCAYQFRLSAWARTTDGFGHLFYQSFSDHYSLNVGGAGAAGCVADLDGDGDVDGADLAIFSTQFGRTNCVALPAQ
jgi:parallel beta-helix repeat protein